MGAFDDVLTANADYAKNFADEGKPGEAARGLAVLTCMDSRISPLEMLGLQPGDAKILRNAGAQVTDEVLRNLVVATHLLGASRILVIGHTDCGMTKVTDEEFHRRTLDLGVDTRSLEIGTIADQRATLERDVKKIRSSPYLPKELVVAGCIYDVRSGLLDVVVPAA